jgi:hypothetical protein
MLQYTSVEQRMHVPYPEIFHKSVSLPLQNAGTHASQAKTSPSHKANSETFWIRPWFYKLKA